MSHLCEPAPVHSASVGLYFLCEALSLHAEFLACQAVMEIQAESASERKTHVPEMQFHMRVVVSEIEETDSHVASGQLLDKNEGVRASIGAELVAAAAFRILVDRDEIRVPDPG